MEIESSAACPVRRVVTTVGDEAWLVTDHAAVRSLFADARLGRSHPAPETAPRKSASAIFGGPVGNFETELDELTWRRSLLSPFFSPKRIRSLVPRVEELTTRLLDEMVERGSPADFQLDFANQLPVLVICELLGVPVDERERFGDWSDAVLDDHDGVRSLRAQLEFLEYCKDLIARKRSNPGDDVLSRLGQVQGIDDDTVARLGMVLLVTGHETTVANIGNGLLGLLADRAQWEMLVADPGLVPTAVEELLRVLNDAEIVRYPRSDIEYDGTVMRAGELVLLDLGSANNDSKVFRDADRLDICRGPGNHLSFGYGLRYCMGAPLARLELQVAFRELVTRLPGMRLAADPASLTFREELSTRRLTSLPVAW